jgi:hypothetical protein
MTSLYSADAYAALDARDDLAAADDAAHAARIAVLAADAEDIDARATALDIYAAARVAAIAYVNAGIVNYADARDALYAANARARGAFAIARAAAAAAHDARSRSYAAHRAAFKAHAAYEAHGETEAPSAA